MSILSIIIPVFNEDKTVYQILEKVKETHLTGVPNKEIIIVNQNKNKNQLRKYLNSDKNRHNKLRKRYLLINSKKRQKLFLIEKIIRISLLNKNANLKLNKIEVVLQLIK